MRILKILFAVSCLFILTGCWDYNELNMQELVLGVGIDTKEDGVTVTIQTAGSGEESGAVYVTEGAGFFDAVRNATSSVGKKLYWGHCRLLLLGEGAAKKDIPEVLDVLRRSQDVYMNISAAVARGCRAGDIISAKAQSGSPPSETVYDMFANAANSKRFFNTQIWEILRSESKTHAYVLSTIRLEDGMPRVGGGAVIKDGALAGFFDDEQMLLYTLMTDSGAGGYLPRLVTDSGERVSFEILKNDVERRTRNGREEIKCRMVVSLGSISSGHEGEDGELRASCGQYLNDKGREVLKYAQDAGFAEILGITDAEKTELSFDVVLNRAGMLREGEE